MIEVATGEPGLPPQNHFCAVAAETYALHHRHDDAGRCVAIAKAIRDRYPGSFNEVHYRWSVAVAAAHGPDDVATAALESAVDAAEELRHAPTVCKGHERLAERYAAAGRFEEAWRHQHLLTAAQVQRLGNRAHVKYYLLKVQHELQHARVERDRADRQRQETLALNGQLERLNAELHRKVREIETLQSQLAAEAMLDPLTRLFNRRYLDATMPGLLAAAERRGEPLAVALVDLDHFKRINDRFGHPAGDAVLVRIGELFADSLRLLGRHLPLRRRGILLRVPRYRRRGRADGPFGACRAPSRAGDPLGRPRHRRPHVFRRDRRLSGAWPLVRGSRRECRPRALHGERRRPGSHAHGAGHTSGAPEPDLAASFRRVIVALARPERVRSAARAPSRGRCERSC